MNYSEYGNSTQHKLAIRGKKYFFRDALKLYLVESKTEGLVVETAEKAIHYILDTIKNSDFDIDGQHRIKFTNTIIAQLNQRYFLARHSPLVHDMIEFYKSKGIISKHSQSFPKVYKETEVNKLSISFVAQDFGRHDEILNIRDELLEAIADPYSEKHELSLYFYLKFFSIKQYDKDVYEYFVRSNIFDLNGTIVLIYKKVHSEDFTQVKICYFDTYLNKALKAAFFNKSDNLFDQIDHYFEKPIKFYEKELESFLKVCYTRITQNEKKHYKKGYTKTFIRRQIELDCQLENTPVHRTLEMHTLHPKTNYLELMKLFPDLINDEELAKIERENITKQKRTYSIDPYDDENDGMLSIKDYLELSIDDYEKLRAMKNYYRIKCRRDHQNYFHKLEKLRSNYKGDFSIFLEMIDYVKEIVSQSKYHENSEKKLASSTIYQMLCTLFNHCYDIIVQEGKIDITIADRIENRIKNIDNTDTERKYKSVINPFLNKFDLTINYEKEKSNVYARKSLIFKKELDLLYERLIEQDSLYYKINDLLIERRVILHQRFIFCMLMYYSGFRESELWSREVKDVFVIDGVITIDAHTNDLIDSFKTMSAKRRVEFTIDDEKYFSIFQEYLRYLEEKKVKYLFPKISQEQKVFKKEVQKLSFFLEYNPIIQEVTGRYTSLHSFRHTFATKSLRQLLMHREKNKSDLYNLINMLGHLGPDVTLRYYVHIDYVLHYLDLELF